MRYISSVVLGFLVLVAFNSCEHDNFDKFVGPSHCPSDTFAITSPFAVSNSNIDLNVETEVITATFNEEVSWKVVIKGNTSGAERIYEDTSTSINITWNGQPNSPRFFTNENISVTLTLPCHDPITHTVAITANNFSTFGPIVSDFDGQGQVANSVTLKGYNATGWSSYASAPNDMTQLAIVNSPLDAPQGDFYLTCKAKAGPSSWFMGGLYHNVSLSSLPTSDPDEIYFNAFISSGDNTTTLLGITLVNGGMNYTKTVLVDWTGWKLVSLPLSSFLRSGLPFADAYNTTSIDYGLNCATATGQSGELNMDFIIFTPYQPFY